MLDRITRMFRPAHARSLDAASGGRRFTGSRTVSNLNAEIAAGGTTIAHRAGYLAHNDPWVRAAVDSLVSNLVGTGYTPVPKHPDPRTRKALGALWRRFVRQADPSGALDLDGMAALAARGMIMMGDSFAILHTRPGAGLAAPLQVELLARAQVPLDRFADLGQPGPHAAKGHRIRAGVEFDHQNRRVAYHVLPAQPGDPFAPLDGLSYQTIRIPAEDVLHVFHPLEIGQVRGLSWLAPVALLAHELAQFQDATLVKQKVSAMFAGFVTDPGDGTQPLPGTQENGALSVGMEPGALIPTAAGATVTFSDPPKVDGYADFVKSHLRGLAAGMGCTYEQVANDYEGVTFSSIRASLLEYRRKMEALQYEFAHQFYDPIWRRFVTLAALSGALDAPDFFDDPDIYLDCDWLPPRWEFVNPAQDVAADVAAIEAKLKSRHAAIAERGYDPAAVDAEIASDPMARPAARPAPPAEPTGDDGEPLINPDRHPNAANAVRKDA